MWEDESTPLSKMQFFCKQEDVSRQPCDSVLGHLWPCWRSVCGQTILPSSCCSYHRGARYHVLFEYCFKMGRVAHYSWGDSRVVCWCLHPLSSLPGVTERWTFGRSLGRLAVVFAQNYPSLLWHQIPNNNLQQVICSLLLHPLLVTVPISVGYK